MVFATLLSSIHPSCPLSLSQPSLLCLQQDKLEVIPPYSTSDSESMLLHFPPDVALGMVSVGVVLLSRCCSLPFCSVYCDPVLVHCFLSLSISLRFVSLLLRFLRVSSSLYICISLVDAGLSPLLYLLYYCMRSFCLLFALCSLS
jgi:hypothetical protein